MFSLSIPKGSIYSEYKMHGGNSFLLVVKARLATSHSRSVDLEFRHESHTRIEINEEVLI